MKGNDYAVGNDGGAPELNTNAQTHGAWGDWRKVYQRLDDEGRAWVDEITECHLEDVDLENRDADPSLSERAVQEKAREAAVLFVLQRRGDGAWAKHGLVVEEEVEIDGETYLNRKVNPGVDASLKHSVRQRNLLCEIGVYPVQR